MVLKQKTFWALLLCIVFAVGFAFLGSIRYPSIKTVDNYVRSINKNDIKGIMKSYTPEAQDNLERSIKFLNELGKSKLQISDIFGKYTTEGTDDINLMYQIYSKDDQSARVILFALENKNGICTSVSSETVDLVLIEDKYYFEY